MGRRIKAPDDVKTGRLGKEGNEEWRRMAPAPFGLPPKTPIAVLQSLAGQPARLRFAPCAWRFRLCNAFVAMV